MCALLVGLPDVTVAGVGEWPGWLRIVIETELVTPSCCGVNAHRHGVRDVELVDLPVFGRPARLVWRKQRWRCPGCRRAWTEQGPQIASSRCAVTTRAARWATVQVGRHGRSVAEVAADLDCDWHTVMDAVALQYTVGGLDEQDAGAAWIDAAKVTRQCVARQLADLAGHLDAGGTGADNDEREPRVAYRCARLGLG